MVLYLPTYVRAPAVVPLPYDLMSVATLVTDDEDQVHWRNGIQFQPQACEPAATTLAQCPVVTGFTKEATADGVPARGAMAFTTYATIPCSPVGNFWEEAITRVTAQLINGESRATSEVFWTGVVTTPGGGSDVVYPHLASDDNVFSSTGEVQLQTAATIVITGVDVVEGLGALEQALAECYGGRGVIHAPREVIPHFATNHLLERVGGRYETVGGNLAAFGPGYTGSGPNGSDAPAGMAWIYATGAVSVRKDPMVKITSDRIAGLDRSVNTLQLYAERTYVFSWDCCLFAALVDLGGIVTGDAGSAS